MTIAKTYFDEEGYEVRVWKNGSKRWHKNGQPHRDEDKPAIVWHDGTKQWYKNGYMHRENNKAYFTSPSLNGRTYFLRGRSCLPKEYWVRLLLLEY